jgi:hypothetical protein
MGLDLNWQVVFHKILEGRDLGGFGVKLALKHRQLVGELLQLSVN